MRFLESLEMKVARLANVEAHTALTLVAEIAAQLIDAKLMSAASFSKESLHAASSSLAAATNERQREHAQLVLDLISQIMRAWERGEKPTLH